MVEIRGGRRKGKNDVNTVLTNELSRLVLKRQSQQTFSSEQKERHLK